MLDHFLQSLRPHWSMRSPVTCSSPKSTLLGKVAPAENLDPTLLSSGPHIPFRQPGKGVLPFHVSPSLRSLRGACFYPPPANQNSRGCCSLAQRPTDTPPESFHVR